MNKEKKFTSNGVGYYNIDNIDKIDKKENRENIANTSFLLAEAVASQTHLDHLSSSQEVAKPESISVTQAPTPKLPCDDTIERMVSQIFYNTNSTQKHKLKVKLHAIDTKPTEWIATMNTDLRVFRKYNNLELARDWIAIVKRLFPQEQGYKKAYLGKFHLVRDGFGLTGSTNKEPGCFAAMSYNTEDRSWYVIIKIYDFMQTLEYDYNYTPRQQTQGVKAQIVWTNPILYKKRAGQTYAQRNGF
jgi:hypothetical protein